MFKRFFLFFLTNILVVVTISIVLNLLGVRPWLSSRGIDYTALLEFCFVWGLAGAFISLQLSRWMAKRAMGIVVIDQQNPGQYAWLVQMVTRLAQAANLPVTPEIGVFDRSEVNAFATGPSKRRSLIAFSTGLLGSMSKDDIEGVTGHELTHVSNGDMVTMALIQGVINAFVMFLSRVVAFALTASGSDDDRRPSFWTYILIPVFEIAFSFLGFIVVCWFSRQREFRADAGSARIAGRPKMIHALQTLEGAAQNRFTAPEGPQAVAALQISGRSGSFLGALLATHPPLRARIDALQQLPL